MKLSQESKKKILEAYIGDSHWLTVIREELKKYKENELSKIDTEYEHNEWENALELVCTLMSMNGVIIDTETNEYLEKYYEKAHELYSEMKIDLTKLIGYEEMWEELC